MLVEDPIVITPPVALVPILIVCALAAVPMLIDPFPVVEVPTSRTMLPAVEVAPAALPVRIFTAVELVDAPD